MPTIRSVLKPEGSVVAAVAVVGLVYATYQLDVGPVSGAYVTAANHPALESSRKKAGYTAFSLVAALTLITRDANVGILGFGAIVAMEAHYRHAIMASPETGQVQAPSPAEYQPATGDSGGAQVYPFVAG
jgi:hypothetical protein